MPGKHVRFAHSNTYFSPDTPALSLSSLSPASSAGPLTPPSSSGHLPRPLPPKKSSSRPPPPRPTYLGPIRAHRYLEYSHPPPIDFDLTLPPSTISRHHRSVTAGALLEPATHPPLPFLSLISPHLPWTIKVSASRGAFVSVLDVLTAIHRTLRVNITPAEFESLPTKRDRHRASVAYEQRYRRLRDAREREEERRLGVKRVDFLMGCTRFLGISGTAQGPDIWVLNVS